MTKFVRGIVPTNPGELPAYLEELGKRLEEAFETYTLNDLDDVDVDNIADTEGIFYNATTGLYEPGAGGGGGASGLPTGYLTGYTTAPNSGNPLTDIDIGMGAARSSDDLADIRLLTAITKQLDNVWVEGDALGGRASGAALAADTWYHMFVITDGSTVDAGFDTSISATNLLADATGYTQFRRIGSILTDSSSQIIPYSQVGNDFFWDVVANDHINVATTFANRTLYTISTPVDIKCRAIGVINGYETAAASYTYIVTDPDQPDTAPVLTTGPFTLEQQGVAVELSAPVDFVVYTNTSSQIGVRSNQSHMLDIAVHGWTDPRSDFAAGAAGQIARATSSEYCPGYTFTFVDTDTWRIEDIDASNLFQVGRRLKFIDGASTYFGTVTAVDFDITSADDTTIDMSMEASAVLTNTITEVCLVTGATAWSPIVDDPFGGDPINDIATGAIGGTQWWVIVGNNGKLATSTDGGLNWTVRTTGTAEHLTSVAYAPDIEEFLAGGHAGVLLDSSNGTTWNLDTVSIPGITGTGNSNIVPRTIIRDQSTPQWGLRYDDTAALNRMARDNGTGTWASGESKNKTLEPYVLMNETEDDAWVQTSSADDVGRLVSLSDVSASSYDTDIFANLDEVTGGLARAPAGQRTFVYFGDLGGVTTALDATAQGADLTTFNARLEKCAYSALHDRYVVVGASAQLGYLDASDFAVNDAWTFVASGFGPTVNINSVAWNNVDGVFIAVGDDGTICRSSNGTN